MISTSAHPSKLILVRLPPGPAPELVAYVVSRGGVFAPRSDRARSCGTSLARGAGFRLGYRFVFSEVILVSFRCDSDTRLDAEFLPGARFPPHGQTFGVEGALKQVAAR